jgi:LysM repeat protein
MSPRKIFPLMLALSLAVLLCVALAPATPASAASPASDEIFTDRYTVAQGDSLSALAQKFGTTIDLLSMANAIPDPSKIRVGQILMVPASGMASDPDAALDILDQQQLASDVVAYDYHGDIQPQLDSDDVSATSAPAAAPATAPMTPGLDD